jgi:hypothetical protein
MKQPDQQGFIEAMQQEINNQTKNGNWEIVKHTMIPEGIKIIPAIWAMKCKRCIATREVYKYKACLNIDGSKQQKGVNYWETYAPVAAWSTIQLVMTMSLIKGWHTKQIDYVLAYMQANVKVDNLYMKIPKGFEIAKAHPNKYALKIKKRTYMDKNRQEECGINI